MGIITSANLTSGGLVNNFEYGVVIHDKHVISTIREDMLKYYALGNILERDLLERVNAESDKLYEIRQQNRDFIENTGLTSLLKKKTDALDSELLKNRIKEGKTINALFGETILYLLKKQEALSTGEMHPLIQTMHSDICDDSIERVIDGQHFGKKWKHLVRDAQQTLKRQELIYLKGGKWRLMSSAKK